MSLCVLIEALILLLKPKSQPLKKKRKKKVLTLVISMKAVLFLGAPRGGEEDLLTCVASSCMHKQKTHHIYKVLHSACAKEALWRCVALQSKHHHHHLHPSHAAFRCSTTCCVYVRASHQKTHECTCILPGSRTLLHSVWVFCCQRPLWVSFPLEKAWLTPWRFLPKNKALQPLLRVLLQQRKARKNSGMTKRKQ